ncbi:MAG: hypothetical protein ACYC57_04635 [Thermoleophilia bacterium]
MKRLLVLSIIAVFALVMATGCEVSTANLQNVKVCSDPDSDNQCESDDGTFDADTEEIFVSGDLENAPDGTELTITWTYLGAEEGDDPEEIDSIKLTTKDGENTFHSNLAAPSGGWPGGDYEIVLDLGTDNSEPVTKSFTIEGDARPAGADLISDLKVCDDPTNDECAEDAETLPVDTTIIYLSGTIGEVPAGTELTITWRFLGNDDLDEQDIDAVVLKTTDTPNVFYSNLESPTDGWPVGDYQIIFELDGKKEATKKFSLE